MKKIEQQHQAEIVKLQDEIKAFKQTLKEQEAAKQEQEVDLDNIDDHGTKLFGTTKMSMNH